MQPLSEVSGAHTHSSNDRIISIKEKKNSDSSLVAILMIENVKKFG